MSGRRWGFRLARLIGEKFAHHKVRRINNPGEVVLKLFFIGCVVVIVVGLAVIVVRAVAYQPEFRQLRAEEMAQ